MECDPSYIIDYLEAMPEEAFPVGENPFQTDIDAAYSVKLFLDHHSGRLRPLALLAQQCGITEERLAAAFLYAFNERLDHYWEKMQWKELMVRS